MDDIARATRERLKYTGAAVVHLPRGRLFLSLMGVYGIASAEILVVYEGGGSMVYAGDRPLNRFRLIQQKFPGEVAQTVADLVNAVVSVTGPKQIEGDNHD